MIYFVCILSSLLCFVCMVFWANLLILLEGSGLLIRWYGVRDPADIPLFINNFSNLNGPAEINFKSICIFVTHLPKLSLAHGILHNQVTE